MAKRKGQKDKQQSTKGLTGNSYLQILHRKLISSNIDPTKKTIFF
jgi:hypothetical protein